MKIRWRIGLEARTGSLWTSERSRDVGSAAVSETCRHGEETRTEKMRSQANIIISARALIMSILIPSLVLMGCLAFG